MRPGESRGEAPGALPYRFDDVVVDPAAHTLVRAGTVQPLEPKSFAVLVTLLDRPGELIARDDLLDRVWGHRHVTPGVLTRAIAQIRHALGDDSHEPRYIQTRHALGYCFIGELHDDPADGLGEPAYSGRSVTLLAPRDRAQDEPPLAEAERDPDARLPARQGEAAPVPPEPPRRLDGVARRGRRHLQWIVALAVLLVVATGWLLRGRSPAGSASSSARPAAASIAVMPFTSLSANHDDDYFAAGLAEEMRDALAGVKGLKVAASISPSIRKVAPDIQDLGARLGVATVLDASVRREGPRIRITARLSDTATGFTLWSHTYDRELAGVLETQSEIAGEVVRSLLGAMPAESAGLRHRLMPTHNAAAFDVYLRGLQLMRDAARPADADKAIARFDEALGEDKGFARAQAKICRTEIWQFQNARSADAFDRAVTACGKAARMDPTLAEVDLALGDLYRVKGDNGRAMVHYLKSVKLPATAAASHVGMAKLYATQGRADLALAQFRQALEVSPGDAYVYSEIGYQQYLDGDAGPAIGSYLKVVALRPDDADSWTALGALYMEMGDSTKSADALEHAIAIRPDAASVTNLGLLKYQAGEYAAAVELQRQATRLAPDDFMMWGNLGQALEADPANAAAAHEAYLKAADQATQYLRLKPDDAKACASLGLYRAILGQAGPALELVQRSEALATQKGDVALLNAETFAVLGDSAQARVRLARARAEGVGSVLISSNLAFRRHGLLSAPVRPVRVGAAASTALSVSKESPPGE